MRSRRIKDGLKALFCAAGFLTIFSLSSNSVKAQDEVLAQRDDRIFCISNSSYTGVAKYQDNWLYVRDGEVDFNYTGLAGNDYGWWYINNGRVNFDYTGMASNEAGWWYIVNGGVDFDYTGMANNETGWWYYRNGNIDFSYTGMADNEYGWWYYRDGNIDFSYTGMADNEAGWWYYRDGNIDFSYTGMGENEYGWWYYRDGNIDFSYTGIARNGNDVYYFNNGRIDYNYTGMCKDGNKYVYFTDGDIDTEYTGIANNSEGAWYYNNGSIDFNFTGEITDAGIRYNVYKGVVDLDSAVDIKTEENEKLISENNKLIGENKELIEKNKTAIEELEKNNYYNYLMMFNRIGGIGDSLMSGGIEGEINGRWNYVNAYNYSWLTQLSKRAYAESTHYSVGGLTCRQWWESDYKTKLAEDENGVCDAYFIGLGTNDKNLKPYKNGIGSANDSTNTDSFAGYYKKIVEYTHEVAPDAPVFLLSLFESNNEAAMYSEVIKQIADKYSYCYYIDVINESDVLANNDRIYSYNIHLNTLGYIAMAQNIERITDKVILENAADFVNYGMIKTKEEEQ